MTTSAAFKPFQWHMDEIESTTIDAGPSLRLAGMARDIAEGLSVVLDLVSTDRLSGSPETVLDDYRLGALVRLAKAAADDLSNETDKYQSWVEGRNAEQKEAAERRAGVGAVLSKPVA